ncbi:MAG: DUF368 domain-containing protein [Clostridiaceae bacterium]|nr:DUF368 domain-containing protein [Clostridiaceae bacterium]
MKYLVYIVKGVVIGIATLVPGVSGGTMSIILGLYDDIIHAISSFFKDMKKNIIFLATVGIGGIIGLLAFSKVMELALIHFRYPMVYLFIGVIIGGMPVLFKKASGGFMKAGNWLYFAAGVLIILVMSFYDVTIVNLANSSGILQFVFLFFAGIIIAVALILPGLSTSFMLLAIGLYDITLNALSELRTIVLHGTTPNAEWVFSYLIPICLGTAFGIITTTKVLERFMNSKPQQTYMLILGFVAGSIVDIVFDTGLPSGWNIVLSIATFILGFLIIKKMSERFSE